MQIMHGGGPDVAASPDAGKGHHGQRYTGMRVGRTHEWDYERGEWNERKITPEQRRDATAGEAAVPARRKAVTRRNGKARRLAA